MGLPVKTGSGLGVLDYLRMQGRPASSPVQSKGHWSWGRQSLQLLSRSRLQQTPILLVDGSETNPGAEEAMPEVPRI